MNTSTLLSIALATISLFIHPSFLLAQTNDFFTNTQSSGLLASSAAGCPSGTTCTANGPGFNPTDLVNHADPNSTIVGTTKIVGGTRPFFSQLGPGAITDNLFGAISQIHPGNDATPNTSDDQPLCGTLPGDPNTGAGVAPNAVGANNSGLNCGDLRFDPTSQGQTIPTGTNTLQMNANPTTAGQFLSDFDPSTGNHTGFDMVNDFTFVLSPLSASSTQQALQVTALTAGGTVATVGTPGTLAAFGSGDQRMEIDTAWSLTGAFDSTGNRPNITWSMSLDTIDPLTPRTAPFSTNLTDTTNTVDLLTSDGAFDYNSGTFPQSTFPFPCWWSGCTLSSASITLP